MTLDWMPSMGSASLALIFANLAVKHLTRVIFYWLIFLNDKFWSVHLTQRPWTMKWDNEDTYARFDFRSFPIDYHLLSFIG